MTRSQTIYINVVKRFFDIIIGLLGIIFLLFPSFLVIFAIYKYKKYEGSIFFTQDRFGKNGKLFKIIKFRSMVTNAEELLKADKALYQKYIANSYKLPPEEDPRLTSIGGFIRKTSIDEIPQFVNILKGDMSFIGPRPILSDELSEYSKEEQLVLLSVKPGATGWWQVSGRSDVLYPERCELELYYVRNVSFMLDVKILLLTIKKVLIGQGAH
ncbi:MULTISPECIES: sugar transferase [unclassified Streptococcus]|uniref:sugar transferase n=1 Tax=unclassified Streptococcus TaxID=2608887 RepID=UPI0011B7D9D2|nr:MULTISPECIES: sugar transferase [unclassified Streptococcus]TWS94597.1 sugar transferase [Streptococcus sp. sy018]TWT14432.1 sugar transferase [Streptococcus sp. sy010]